MDVSFEDDGLRRLEHDASYDAGFAPAVVRAFRRRMQQIRAAADERDFYALRSLNFEKLKGERAGQYSMRLNKQWRLVLKLEGKSADKKAVLVEIVDYH
jgi:proteic killer suppression protein